MKQFGIWKESYMSAILFDTIKFLEKLISAGIPSKQAKAQIEIFSEAMQVNTIDLASKRDLREVEVRLEARIDKLESKLEKVEIELSGQITLLRWMMSFVLAGITTVLVKLFI